MPKSEFLTLAHAISLEELERNRAYYNKWYLSRKLNGFSAIWDGGLTRGMFAKDVPWYKGGDKDKDLLSTGLWSRRGKVIRAPKDFLDQIPQGIPLQGEIWYNDNKRVAAVVNDHDRYDYRWKLVKFMVYNYKPLAMWGPWAISLLNEKALLLPPDWVMNGAPFRVRLDWIRSTVKGGENSAVEVVPQTPLGAYAASPIETMRIFMDGSGWEGYMLANPEAQYQPYRTRNLLKIKPEYDTEAEIIGHTPGRGRHEGRMGALVCSIKWDEKVTGFHGGKKSHVGQTVSFNVGGGFSDTQREWGYVHEHFKVGNTITVKFNEVGVNGAIPSGRYFGD